MQYQEIWGYSRHTQCGCFGFTPADLSLLTDGTVISKVKQKRKSEFTTKGTKAHKVYTKNDLKKSKSDLCLSQ